MLPRGWLRVTRTRDGRRLYGVPSKTVDGLVHLVNLEGCTCKGFGFNKHCSHHDAVIRFVAQARGLPTA